MNRQPFLMNGSTHHYYDEDVDQRELLDNGITCHFLCRSTVKKPTSWTPTFTTNGSNCCGQITNVRGFNLHFWRRGTGLSAKIEGLATRDDAIKAARQLVRMIFP